MRSTRIVLALLPGYMDVLRVHRGRVTDARRVQVAPGSDAQSWRTAVRESADRVRMASTELGAAGCTTHVLMVSPTQSVDQVSLESRSTGDARQAVLLSLAESLSYPADQAVLQSLIVARDQTGQGRRMHLVGAAESDQTLAAVSDMVHDAGLKLATVTPLNAVVIACLMREVLTQGPKKDSIHAVLYVGQHSSFFLVAADGRVAFGRTIAICVEHLVVSLTRPLLAGAGAIELDYPFAMGVIYQHGIPQKGAAETTVRDGITHQQLMPLMQPILQRFIVELRQSLRFGLMDTQRERLTISLRGPGAGVPGLAELIGAELGVATTAEVVDEEFNPIDPCSAGSETFLALDEPEWMEQLNLLPRAVAQNRQVLMVRNWLWSGAVAAALLIGFDLARYQSRLSDARFHAASAALQSASTQTLRATTRKLDAALAATNELQARVARETGGNPDVQALMHELSRLTPRTLLLTSVILRRGADRVEGQIAGQQLRPSDDDGRGSLDGFIASLKASPLVSEVTLRSVQFAQESGDSGQRFDVTFRVVAPPDGRAEASVAAAIPGGAP